VPDTSEYAEVTIGFLESFLAAWNRHDIEGIIELLEPDCQYITGDGAGVQGHEQIRTLLADFLGRFRDAHWRDATHFISGDRGASEWIFTGTGADGQPFKMDSCDLFTFRNSKIAVVSAYRRSRPQP
jgi:ketosteroid isomerase-like protein